jgi:hypothetical protein
MPAADLRHRNPSSAGAGLYRVERIEEQPAAPAAKRFQAGRAVEYNTFLPET